jgi:hypothetical protein
MFLGMKGAENPAPAAFCTVEEGHGDYMNQKWLSCDNDFDYSPGAVDVAGHLLVTSPAPPFCNPNCMPAEPKVRGIPHQERPDLWRPPSSQWEWMRVV